MAADARWVLGTLEAGGGLPRNAVHAANVRSMRTSGISAAHTNTEIANMLLCHRGGPERCRAIAAGAEHRPNLGQIWQDVAANFDN